MSNPTLEQVLNTNAPLVPTAAADLNNLSSGSSVVATNVISNVPGDSAGCGFPWCTVKFHAPVSGAPTAGSVIDGWFLTAADGSTYEQGSSSVTPARPPDFSLPAIATSATIDLEQRGIPFPVCSHIKVLIRNNGLGEAFDPSSTSASYLKIYPYTDSLPTGQT